MTIQDIGRFVDALWDWGILKGCFGNTQIKPTDIDGLVERSGRFLLLEAKGPGVKLKQAQWLTFKALRETGLFTVVIVWGEKNKPGLMQVLYPKPYPRIDKPKPASLEDLRRICSAWFQYAEKKRGMPCQQPKDIGIRGR